MPFPFDEYPWAKFEDLNIAYMIQRLGAIISEANAKLEELDAWKTATEQDLENWKNATMDLIAEWEHDFMADVHEWEQDTEQDLAQWKIDTIAALDTWKATFITQYEALRVEVEHIRDVANAAAQEATAAAASAAADAAELSAATAELARAAKIRMDYLANGAPDAIIESSAAQDQTYNGITFTWNDDKTRCHIEVSGTRSAVAFSNIWVNTSEFPAGIGAGSTCDVKISGNTPGIALRLALQPTSLPDRVHDFENDGTFEIPSNATGLTSRLNVETSAVIPSGGLDVEIHVNAAPNNKELDERITSLENESRFLTPAEVSALSTLLDCPVNKIFGANGTRLLQLNSNLSSVPIRPNATYEVKCYEYSADYKSFIVYTVDGRDLFMGWTAVSHPTSITWEDRSPRTYTPRKTRKILVFGNSSSFGMDGYTPSIYEQMCPDVSIKMGILYGSGESLTGHVNAFDNDTLYSVYSEYYNGTWHNYENSKTSKNVLDSESWDLIIIQQSLSDIDSASNKSAIAAISYRITNRLTHPCAIAFNQSYAKGANSFTGTTSEKEAASDNQYQAIVSYCQDALIYGYVSDVIPCGTAVQNARKTNTLKNYGNMGYLCYDSIGHLQNGIGVFIASITSAMKIAEILHDGAFGLGFSTPLNPTDAWLTAIDLYTKTLHGPCVGVTDINKLGAEQCAMQALKWPYELKGNTI